MKDAPDITLGLLSYQPSDGYVEAHLIEIAKSQRGKHRRYAGIAGILLAYACHRSQKLGFDGFVLLRPKTVLRDHYIKQYGAVPHGRHMVIFTEQTARKLMEKYLHK